MTHVYHLPDAWFISIKDDQYIGMSVLQKHQNFLNQSIAGVVKRYRRQGLTMAMQIKGIEYAKKTGVKEIVTGSNKLNQPMLMLNKALGFVRKPAWLIMNQEL